MDRVETVVTLTLVTVAMFFLFIGIGSGLHYARSDIARDCENFNGTNINGTYYHCTQMTP